MKALCVLLLTLVVLSVHCQNANNGTSNNNNNNNNPTQVNPFGPTASTVDYGAYSPEHICAQGPGMMQGQPVYQQGGFLGFSGGSQDNPCTVTCQNQQVAWMVAKPHGAPCRIPSDPEGERYCLNQICVAYNASLNDYCRGALNVNANSPSYMALMPYGCTVACLDKSVPSIVQVQFANGMACQIHTPNRRITHGYCMNGACSTLTYKNQGGFFDNFLDPGFGQYPMQGQWGGSPSNYPSPAQGYNNPFQSIFGNMFGGRRR